MLNQPVSAFAGEHAHVPHEFNDTVIPFPQHRLIHELFEDQAARTPDAPAVLYAGRTLSYAKLNAKANQLARYLRKKGVGADRVVALCVERSFEMVVGLLGVLKAGGAYVPLDPNYPAERLQHMLEDADPQVVLTQEKLLAALPPTKAEVLSLDGKAKEIAGYQEKNLSCADLHLGAQHLVYVIYTSGSTGRPKGTAMCHRSMVNLIEWHRCTFPVHEGTRVLQFAALSFDVAFQETFSTLCTGGTLVLLDEWVRKDSRALLDLLIRERIQSLFLPPLVLQSLAEASQSTGIIPRDLCDVITAGEQLRISPAIASLFKALGTCRLHNHYGPTETHVVTALTLTGDPCLWPELPTIGRPIANSQIHILNDQREPLPLGQIGEIYIAGAGVARGYLRRPELTAERFLNDPFSATAPARMYKTGDVGRWRPDGTIEYLGRNDYQVKVRGFRIELGEIEAQLARHEQVKDCAVIAREDIPGQKRLVAYIISREPTGPSVEYLRAHLKAALPEYMVPSAFVLLERLPLNPNGKLDRQALPAPALDAYSSRAYEAPRSDVERLLANVCQDLLRVDRIGRADNFFELGGDSLLMVQLMERLRQAGLTPDARMIFEHSSLGELAEALSSRKTMSIEVPANLIPPACERISPDMLPLVRLDAHEIELIEREVPGGAANIQDIYPLAPLQEGILFHHLLNEGRRDTYVLPILLAFPTQQKLNEFIAALRAVIERHDVLRTAVLWEQLPQPVQVVYRKADLPHEKIALDPGREAVEQLRERMHPQEQWLDLTRAPLLKLQTATDPQSEQCYAVMQLHHLLCDHESLETLLEEAAICLDGRAHELPEPVPYRNHVAQVLAQAREHDAEAFFRNKLSDIDEPTAPFGLIDVHGDSCRIHVAHRALPNALAQQVRKLARRLSVSAATLFHAAWALVVARTSGRDDVVFASLLSGRLQGSAGAQRTLGMFINTLPLRLRLAQMSAQELLEQTQRELVELIQHEQASLALAQRCSGLAGSAPLFSSLLNCLHSKHSADIEHAEQASLMRVLALQEWSNYPVSLAVDDQGDAFMLMAQTDRRIDPERVLEYFSAATQSLIEALEHAPGTLAVKLSILPEPEHRQLIETFSDSRAPYPQGKLFHSLFEEHAARDPNAQAVSFNGEVLTYAELNAKANQLARYLRTQQIGPDRLVALCVERSFEMVVGLLGVLKAGGAYVPLDPDYPRERLQFMVNDAAPTVLLTQDRLTHSLPQTNARVIALDQDWPAIAAFSDQNLPASEVGVHTHHLAYVIYTSGSTGTPKGVMVEHAGLCNLASMHADVFGVRPGSRVLQFASLCFDASIWECVMAWGNGAQLCLASREELAPGEPLLRTLCSQQITHVTLPPVAVSALPSSDGLYLQTLLVGGEACPPALARDWASGRQFVNAYGPTEITVCATFHECEARESTSVPIGRPVPNTQIYILDRHGEPVPVGVPGEIHIAGVGIARGYLNRAELTAERFVANPFSTEPNARMYKTGDLGQWRADGTIEYLGRNDHQVKIRGFRIELGEIEAQLAQQPQVKEALVLAREDLPGDKRLVAYITLREAGDVSIEALRARLKERLPDYMVPSAFVILQQFPLTPNGKIDRRVLPAPELEAYASRRYEAPYGEVEEALAGIWQSLLRVQRVGREDNFFELGGHSLLATQLVVRVRAAFSAELPMRALFESPTLKGLAAQLDALLQAQLLAVLSSGGEDLEQLLERVAAMPESAVQEWVRTQAPGGQS
jgi:amino acid adenylation domain-containing protein